MGPISHGISGSGNGLLPDSTKPLFEPMLTYYYADRRRKLTMPLSWTNERVRGSGLDHFLDKIYHYFRGVWKRSIQEARMARDSFT